jgi:hypothetical protein
VLYKDGKQSQLMLFKQRTFLSILSNGLFTRVYMSNSHCMRGTVGVAVVKVADQYFLPYL